MVAQMFLYLLIVVITETEAFRPSGDPQPLNRKPFDQTFDEQYSPLKYMGNVGPYSSRRGEGISTEIPAGCEIDQVVLLSRHGERYPSPHDAAIQKDLYELILKSHPEPFSGDLEFLNHWTYFLESDGDIGLEISSGPYSGLVDAYQKGSAFAGRYGHLWDGESGVPIFASSSERVVESARQFGKGFFNANYSDIAQINIISEAKSAGANALSANFCDNKLISNCPVDLSQGFDGIFNIVFPEFDVAAIRLNEEHNLNLTGKDIGVLFEIGAFDVSARGNSPWLDVFTREEWLAYAYRRSLHFYCYFGHGSDISQAYGTNWANATTALLNQGPSYLPLVLNFGHDTDITNFLSGIGALVPSKEMSTERVTFGAHYDIDDIVPMGAQLILERLKCHAPGSTNSTDLAGSSSSLSDSLLNSTNGDLDVNQVPPEGYISPDFTNSTVANSSGVLADSTQYLNGTLLGPYANTTTVVVNDTTLQNGTLQTVNVTQITTVYGFNATNGTSNEQPVEDSFFVRVILNDAVLPLDFCYDGPGYSCSLSNWTEHIADRLSQHNFTETCQAEKNGVPSTIDFYWNYNKSTELDSAKYIPWQGKPVM